MAKVSVDFVRSEMNSKVSFSIVTNNNNVQIYHQNDTFAYKFASMHKSENIFTLAKAFLSISPMSHKKLQKLCYYAKAWYLALYDCNLIPEQFQAWVYGAVQPLLYQKYKQYGYADIPLFRNIQEIPEEFLSFAKEVYDSYGHLTGDELERLNHQEAPWIEARGNCKPWESCTNEISEDSIKKFFRKMIV